MAWKQNEKQTGRKFPKKGDYLSGGDYETAVGDLGHGAGVMKKIKHLWNLSGGAQVKSLRNKEFRVNIAQILVPELSRKKLLDMGIDIGVDLYNTAARHSKNGGGVFSYGVSAGGRNQHPEKAAVENEWVERAVPTRHTNANNETIYNVFGSLRKHALEISTKLGSSLSTAYRFRPPFIARRHKSQDLCVYCENLWKLRHKAAQLANDLGGNVQTLENPGQNIARGPGKEATNFLRQHVGALGAEGQGLLEQITVVEEHEKLAAALAEELRVDIQLATQGPGDVLVIQYDFRSLLELRPTRGDSWDYYNKHKMNVLGLAAYVPGRGNPVFVDVISPDLRHDSEAGGAALIAGTNYVLKNLIDRNELERVAFWSDCGRHFRNRFIAYELLENNFIDIPCVEMRFVGENHGKSVVDGHFNWIGACAKNADSDWSDPATNSSEIIKGAAERAKGDYAVAPIFVRNLEFRHEPTMLDFSDVSVVHKIARVGHKLFTEEKEIAKKITMVVKEEKEPRRRKTKPGIDEVVAKMTRKTNKR